jgi:endonuclease/exonuclease/phosphatase family metal-dependent hydrolase
LILLVVVLLAPGISRTGIVMLAAAQAATIVLLGSAATRRFRSDSFAFVVGMLAWFVLLFLFYNHYEWPLLWIVAVVGVVLVSVPARMPALVAVPFSAPIAIAVVITLIGLTRTTSPPRTHPDSQLRILTYNIHQGYDAVGVPGMQRIADEIVRADADVVALEETGRGWTFVGGADLIAYLQYRFPGYTVHFVPTMGQLWGVALMSRMRISSPSGSTFVSAPGSFRYGYASAMVHWGEDSVRVVGVHLTAGLEGNGADARVDQANQLLHAVANDEDVIVAGDFNAEPSHPPIHRIIASGLADAGAMVGLSPKKTWPATQPEQRLDYVFVRGPISPVGGEIRRTMASDHLPVLVTFTQGSRWD